MATLINPLLKTRDQYSIFRLQRRNMPETDNNSPAAYCDVRDMAEIHPQE
jgi:hypothetical protein